MGIECFLYVDLPTARNYIPGVLQTGIIIGQGERRGGASFFSLTQTSRKGELRI
jgi:hypothetical protein